MRSAPVLPMVLSVVTSAPIPAMQTEQIDVPCACVGRLGAERPEQHVFATSADCLEWASRDGGDFNEHRCAVPIDQVVEAKPLPVKAIGQHLHQDLGALLRQPSRQRLQRGGHLRLFVVAVKAQPHFTPVQRQRLQLRQRLRLVATIAVITPRVDAS